MAQISCNAIQVSLHHVLGAEKGFVFSWLLVGGHFWKTKHIYLFSVIDASQPFFLGYLTIFRFSTTSRILIIAAMKNSLCLFRPIDFGGVRPGQPGRGLPVRSVSLDMNVSPQQPSLQYPIRATSPYALMQQQQQQQGMVGNHNMMANQAGMVNAGGWAESCHATAKIVYWW